VSAGPVRARYGGSCRSFDLQIAAFRAGIAAWSSSAAAIRPPRVPASGRFYSQVPGRSPTSARSVTVWASMKAHLVGACRWRRPLALQFRAQGAGRVLSATWSHRQRSDDPGALSPDAEANAKQIERGRNAGVREQMGGNPNRFG